jgi:hypothetical protein
VPLRAAGITLMRIHSASAACGFQCTKSQATAVSTPASTVTPTMKKWPSIELRHQCLRSVRVDVGGGQ